MSIVRNIKKTINYSKKNGYKEAVCAAWERVTAKYYSGYSFEEISDEELNAQKQDKEIVNYKISIVVPAYETKAEYLTALIESCVNQSYANFELIIADGSDTDVVKQTVDKYIDERIKYIKLPENGGISDNSNHGILYATGDYCGLLDHDDLLTKDALYEMVKALTKAEAEGKTPILLYSDEDKCDSNATNFYDPHYKLDFNFDLILTNNYICHFLLIKTSELRLLQLRKQFDGAQDYDLVLRVVSSLYLKEKQGVINRMEDFIVHVPKILYHWRCHEESTAENPLSKMYAYEAGRKALADYTSRVGWKADIRHNKHLGFYRIAYRNPVLTHREDVAAVGGYVAARGKIMTGVYRGQPLVYAGYMNRMDLYQNIKYLDIRNMELGRQYHELYEAVTGHAYISTFISVNGTEKEKNEVPGWMNALNKDELDKLNKKLSKALIDSGARLLLDPESVRKI